MILTDYISRKAPRLLPFVVAALLWGCSDVLDAPEVPTVTEDSDAQLVITLAIPQGDNVAVIDSRAGETDNNTPDISDPTVAPKVNELQINSLQLYIFPYSASGSKAPAVNTNLYCPSPDEIKGGQNSMRYEVKGLEKGVEYKMYLLANFGEGVRSFANESQLRNYTVTYTAQSAHLRAGNLPMVYESKGLIKIEPDATAPISMSAALQYACAKIRYSIVFDKANETTAQNFGESFLKPIALTLRNVSNTLSAVYNSAANHEGEGKSFDRTITNTGAIYTAFTVDESKKNVSDDYMVTVDDETSKISADAIGKDTRWVYQGVAYVPERYVDNADNQLQLHMNSQLNGSEMGCEHQHTIGIENPDGFKHLHRGYCYDFVGTIVNTGANGMVWTCKEVEWVNMTVNADFVHTYLTLSATEVTVTSEENGELTYETDGRGALGFDCDEGDKINGRNIFELAPSSVASVRKLVIRPNSRVSIADLRAKNKLKGTTTCYIIAGNIKKAITVNYDLSSFLEVTPESMKIQDGDGTVESDHIFEYRTNTGGFTITSTVDGNESWKLTVNSSRVPAAKVHQVGDSYFTMSFSDSSDNASGVIKITGAHPSSTTVVHTFKVHSDDPDVEDIYLSVELMATSNVYRVYFRAINDYQATDADKFGSVPAESNGTGTTNNNWIDYWDSTNRKKNTPSDEAHALYAYTQYGETPNDQPVWRYTYWDSGSKFHYYNSDTNADLGEKTNYMTGDTYNPGWYYYDLPKRCKGDYDTSKQTDLTKPGTTLYDKYGNGPIPGATLLIFHSADSRHRVNFENEPGIPLGDYNDGESWVLFDPTRDPVYNVYDDKPVIEDVTYTVYSNVAMTGWRNDFGCYDGGGTPNIHGDFLTSTSSSGVSGYPYKYTIKFKAPRGEYDKNILLITSSTQIAKPVPPTGVLLSFYFGVPDNADNNWHNPHIRIKGGNEYGGGDMVKAEKCGSIQYYRYDFTQSYEVDDAKSNGVKIYSNNMAWSSDYRVLNGTSAQEVVVDYDNWNVHNLGDALAGQTVQSGTTMMNGNSWKTGYYKSTAARRWTQTPQ
ncbi:MAG: hypothetical protein K2M19_08235 [Muribaculaceae bacterium]|nr:hypothetical protein [Muribaculaceae bacterium]